MHAIYVGSLLLEGTLRLPKKRIMGWRPCCSILVAFIVGEVWWWSNRRAAAGVCYYFTQAFGSVCGGSRRREGRCADCA
jgi:hypothetical protein